MDSPSNSKNSDGETIPKSDTASFINDGSINPIIENVDISQPKVNELCVKDVPPHQKELVGDEEVRLDKVIILEQQFLVKPFESSLEILIDGNTNEESSNNSELKNVHDNDFSSEKSDQLTEVGDQITGKLENLSNVDTLNKKAADSEESKDDLMHLNDTENTMSIDASFGKQSVEILNPDLSAVTSENGSCPNQSSSLALLAQYDTENDSDDEVLEVSNGQTYQNHCVEIDSDSATSDVEFLSEIHSSNILDRLDADIEGEDDDDDEEGTTRIKRQPKVKGELDLDDLPPIADLHITVPEEECTELGKINSIVDQLVLVNVLPGTVPLDLETVLFRDKGKQVLGEVFDVLGQVSDPLYCVRFNSNKEIKEKGIEVGQTVYVAPRTEHTQFIILANLMKVRGSDASWENDVEPPPRFIDYSDDEEERSARRPNRKRQSSGGGAAYVGRGAYVPRRPYRGNYSGRGGVRQPYQAQGNYNIVGNSWHTNFYQPPMFNQPQYRMPVNSPGGYMPPNFNNSPYHQPPPVNTGLVLNPYSVYPPSQSMQHPVFPPRLEHPPPSM